MKGGLSKFFYPMDRNSARGSSSDSIPEGSEQDARDVPGFLKDECGEESFEAKFYTLLVYISNQVMFAEN